MGGLSVANEDVVSYNGATFSLAFDGSDVGLASRRLDAFGWLNATTLLFSLDTDGATLPGVAGTIDDSDVIRFDATSLGATTSGAFSVYFDGSDVGLTTAGEDVDAFELLSNGDDRCCPPTARRPCQACRPERKTCSCSRRARSARLTSGTYAMYFDGSDVGISTSNENVDAAAVDAQQDACTCRRPETSPPPVSAERTRNVFVFNPTALGATTSGTFSSTLYFDGSAFGLGGNDIAAIDLSPGT